MSPLILHALQALLPVVFVAVELLAITVITRIMNRIAFERFGKRLYLLLMWPGVCVHELSHAAACLLTRTRITEVHLFAPQAGERGELVLGYVAYETPRSRLARAFIGSAPFFGGTAVLLLLAWWAVPHSFALAQAVIGNADPGLLFQRLVGFAAAAGSEAWQRAHGGSGWTWLAVYLFLSVSAHVAPSRPDLKATVIALAAVILAVAPALAVLARFWPAGFLAVAVRFGQGAALVAGFLAVGLVVVATACAVIIFVSWPVLIWQRIRHRSNP